MSQATKRKHVVKEVLGEYVNPTGNQQIVKVVGSRGNNLHEAVTAQGSTFLVSMPPKFRKNIWIKRGDYVIVDPIAEGEKVKAEISVILYKDHIQHLQTLQLWPDGFVEQPAPQEPPARPPPAPQEPPARPPPARRAGGEVKDEQDDEGNGGSSDSSEEEDDSDLFVNTNRPDCHYSESEESEEEDDSEKDTAEERTEARS
ncbi:hypothetical protein NHX12_010829 [Muraenolepis orangiensis]|uniref:Probable RNA-binding protein EIF1AD n=1 Tax=Muraenolepis orangiensis TaxID=630683 RepID=A0A9Q0I885_9TELE|nr:hypothetical protein NHX12_010829 [Muraenolepis orangiensis]